jgi:hypothetical protein
MANRSYLYAIDVVPSADSPPSKSRCVGLSEFSSAIPIVFKLLLSGNPRTCRSIIWRTPDDIALVGEYAPGFRRLKEFLAQIDLPAAQPLIKECLRFLEDKRNRRKYFLLECGEVFDLTEEPIDQQNAELLNQIRNLDAEIQQALDLVKTSPVDQPIPKELPPDVVEATKDLGAEIENLFAGLLPSDNQSRLTDLLSEAIQSRLSRAEREAADPLHQFYRLGLGHWSNILYYGVDKG